MLSVALTCLRPGFDVVARFDIGPGEMLGLFGPSGAGKSTLLSAIAGLLLPREGSVRLGERLLTDIGPGRTVHVPPWRRGVGLLTQDAAGFPHLNVAQNIAYGLPGRRLDAAALQLAQTLGIGHLLQRRVQEISGGERRRVALAQTLARHPAALLLDEPFAALDEPVRRDLGDLVRRVQRRSALPTILVGHDLAELQRLCDRIAVVIAGTVEQIAEPAELVARPVNAPVAQLVGYSSLLPGRLFGRPDGVFAVHPDRVRLGRFPGAGPVLPALVARRAPFGFGWRVWLRLEGAHEVVCTVPPDVVPPAVGQTTQITLIAPPFFPCTPSP